MVYSTSSPEETAAVATGFASRLRAGDLVCLRGELGAGKSVFARAAIRALCRDPDLDVPSPTFTLVQAYDAPVAPVWHLDLYRLESPDEVYELGWDACLADGITFVEWPERIETLLPPARIEIVLTGSRDRRIVIQDGPDPVNRS